MADGAVRLGFPARDTAGMIRGALYGTTRHKILGVIDTPLPHLARMTGEFRLRAVFPSVAARDMRPKGGVR